MSNSNDLSRGMLLSLGIHFTLFVIAFVGLPDWFNKKIEPQPMVISLEPLPITDRTNVKPSQQPIIEQKKPPTPTPPEPPKPPTSKPKQSAPPQVTKSEPPKEKPKETPKPADIEKKDAPKKPEPLKEKPTPTPPKKAEPKPEAKPAKEVEDAMEDEALKDLINKATAHEDKKAKADAKPAPAQNLTKSDAPYDPSLPLSISERDAITSQFVKCWRLPAGSADDYSLKVSVDVWLRPDGSLVKAHLTNDQRGKYNSDSVFRAAADGALRAVHMCSPLKNLPTNKYETWKEMRLNFDPSMQLH